MAARIGRGYPGKALRAVILVLTAFILFYTAVPAFATTDQPDSIPSITYIHVNRNLYETDDMLIFGMYDIPYATLPDDTAEKTFTFYLLSTDGTTQLGYNLPFVYFDSGYNKGLIAFYFPAASAMVWESAYILRIAENPLQFTTPVNTDVTLLTSNYSSLTTQDDNQSELASKLYEIGQIFENTYSASFFQSAGNRQILTSDGETYFRGVINNLQALTPNLFLIQQYDIDTTAESWTTTQFDTYQNRFDGTWVGTEMDTAAEQLGTEGDLAMFMLATLPICVLAIVFSSWRFRRAEAGFVAVGGILIMAVLMGWVPKAIFACVYQALGIYSAYLIFYSRG